MPRKMRFSCQELSFSSPLFSLSLSLYIFYFGILLMKFDAYGIFKLLPNITNCMNKCMGPRLHNKNRTKLLHI